MLSLIIFFTIMTLPMIPFLVIKETFRVENKSTQMGYEYQKEQLLRTLSVADSYRNEN